MTQSTLEITKFFENDMKNKHKTIVFKRVPINNLLKIEDGIFPISTHGECHISNAKNTLTLLELRLSKITSNKIDITA